MSLLSDRVIDRYLNDNYKRDGYATYSNFYYRMNSKGDKIIYSYGYHFPLCFKIKDNKGNVVHLINGDKYSVTYKRYRSEHVNSD